MKIAFISQPWNHLVPPVQASAIAIWTYQVANRLSQANNDVIIYTPKKGYKRKSTHYAGVCYQYIPTKPDEVLLKLLNSFSSTNNNNPPLFASSLYYLGYALQIALDLRKQQCDIVHIHNFSQFIPIIRALNLKTKIILHMHCEWLTQLEPTMIGSRLHKADLVIGCSNYITGNIKRCFPQFAHHCQTVYNGVDLNHFVSKNHNPEAQENGSRQLLFIGRISPEKGVHVLLDAFQKVVQHYPKVQLKVVGPQGSAPFEFIVGLSDDAKVLELASYYRDNYFSALKEKITPNIASQVTFQGHVPHSQLVKYYQGADIFISPSVCNEAFGMPIVEALAAGVPVIATRSGAFPEIVEEGRTGLLVERGNAIALADAILYLLKNEDLRKSMSKAERQPMLEPFSWERVVESLLCQYKNIL